MSKDDRELIERLGRLRDMPTAEISDADLTWWLRQPGAFVPSRIREFAATRLEALQAQPVGEEKSVCEHCGGNGYTGGVMPPEDMRGEYDVCCEVCLGSGIERAALTASPPVVDDLSPATRRMEQILDAPFVRKGEAPQAFERLQAMMPADRARDGMTTIAVRGEDMRALLDAILDRSATSAPPVVEREAIGEIAATILRDVCELGGYTSPDDQPDLLQCTIGELDLIVRRALGDDQ